MQQHDLNRVRTDSEGDAESGGHDAYDDEARIIGLSN